MLKTLMNYWLGKKIDQLKQKRREVEIQSIMMFELEVCTGPHLFQCLQTFDPPNKNKDKK